MPSSLICTHSYITTFTLYLLPFATVVLINVHTLEETVTFLDGHFSWNMNENTKNPFPLIVSGWLVPIIVQKSLFTLS